ncbi:MAG: hypothetical protein II776_04510 [Clostridia bacterium]|nr:hypothetical protein [Clostridia bacterium]
MIWLWLSFGALLAAGAWSFSSRWGKGAAVLSFFMAGASFFSLDAFWLMLIWISAAVGWALYLFTRRGKNARRDRPA